MIAFLVGPYPHWYNLIYKKVSNHFKQYGARMNEYQIYGNKIG